MAVICCIAIIGKANNPLYLRVFNKLEEEDDDYKFHYISHTALDIIEERVGARKTQPITDMYLGLLFPSESYKMYDECVHVYK